MKLARRQKAVPKKHRHKQLQNPRNTHEKKFWNHEFPTRKNLGPMKYLQAKHLDPQNTAEKKLWNHKNPRVKMLDLRYTDEGTMARSH